MKKSIILFTGIILVSIAMDSCKKGKDDPLISLKSRDARLTGEWKLVKMESISNRNGSDTSYYPENYTYKFDGSTMIETLAGKYYNYNTNTYMDTSYTKTYPYSRLLAINKDGTYSDKETSDGDIYEVNDRWSWLDDGKKKTQLLLYDDGIYTIDRLANKELTMSYEYSYNDTESGGGYWYKSEYSAKLTFEQ